MYVPGEHECERASNGYLMSLAAAFVGMPIPIVNVLATVGFAIANRNSTPFVKWHTTQALLSQLFLFPINSFMMYMSWSVFWKGNPMTNAYIGYLITVMLFNVLDCIATIHAAAAVRKGQHVQWWFFAELTQMFQPGFQEAESAPMRTLNPFKKP